MQSQEENAGQLLAAAALGSWASATRGVRCLANSLPEDAAWAREQLAKVEIRELRALVRGVNQCAQQGLDSTPLRKVVLRRLCQEAEANPRGLAVEGLGAEGERGGLRELAVELDSMASGLTAARATELLPQLVAALQALVSAGGSSWHEEVSSDGVLHVARAGLVANSMFAEMLRERQLAEPAGAGVALPVGAAWTEEEVEQMADQLTAFWQALGRLPSSARVGSRLGRGRSAEAAEIHRDLQQRFRALQAPPPPPPLGAVRPAEDLLPGRLSRHTARALGGRAVSQKDWQAAYSQAAGCSSQRSGFRDAVSAFLNMAAWATLIGLGVVAASEDGFGFMRFHALPEAWKTHMTSILLERNVSVEDRPVAYEVPASQATSFIPPMDMQASYIEVPQ